MNTNPMVIKFIQEFFQRLFTKSPKFFRVWQLLLSIATIVTGLPELLQYLHITLPPSLAILENQTVSIATSAALLMTLLTTQSKPVGVTTTGEVIKKTNETKLPFTATAEQKSAEKKNVPDVQVTKK